MLDFLKKVNDFLEEVPSSVTKFFKAAFKSGEEFVQDEVDSICRWVAWQVNINIERLRQKVIKALWEQYSKYLVMLKAASVVKRFLTNPIKAIKDFAEEFFKPFKVINQFIRVLTKEIPRLAKNLAEVVNALPPDPPNPRINFNAFKLKVHTISMKEILLGPAALPPPEQMFPEPPKPFGKETFNAAFEGAKKKAADEEVVFKLPDWAQRNNKVSGGTEEGDTTIA